MILTLLLLTFSLWAGAHPSIPRAAVKEYVDQGIFEGGSEVRANLENLRVAPHTNLGYERWVLDFSDEKNRQLNSIAPKFQVRFLPARKALSSQGEETTIFPAKFIVTLQSIDKSYLDPKQVKRMARKSKYVSRVTLYPPIENGDLVLEMELKDPVLFEAHQPQEKEGRLVLDLKLKPAPSLP